MVINYINVAKRYSKLNDYKVSITANTIKSIIMYDNAMPGDMEMIVIIQ